MSGSSKATSLKAASRTAEASPPAASGAPTGSDGLTKRAGWHVPRSRAVDPSPAALLKEGTQAKERGNHLFRKNEHRAAIRLYKQAILSTRGLYSRTCAMSIYSYHIKACAGGKAGSKTASRSYNVARLSRDEEAQLRQLTQSLHANLSACYLKLDDWEKAVRYAAVVLESDPGNVKSMLRLGQAYHMLGDLLGADRILTKAAALHYAMDALGKALRETLRVVRAKMRSKERRMAHQHYQQLQQQQYQQYQQQQQQHHRHIQQPQYPVLYASVRPLDGAGGGGHGDAVHMGAAAAGGSSAGAAAAGTKESNEDAIRSIASDGQDDSAAGSAASGGKGR